ncbi:MAG: glycosyltransferase family 29 protein [Colwellia sp.]
MSIKRKLKKLINEPSLFFSDSKIVKNLVRDDVKEISKLIQTAPKSKPKANLAKASTSFRLVVEDASVRSMELVGQSTTNLNAGNVEKAINCADRAVALDKFNVFAYIACCRAREKREGQPLVLEYASSLYKLIPDNNLSQLNYARCAKNHGVYDSKVEAIYTDLYQKDKSEETLVDYLQYIWECKVAQKDIALSMISRLENNDYSDKTNALIGAYLFDAGLKKESLKIARSIIDNKASKFIKKYSAYYTYLNAYYAISKTESDKKTILAFKKIDKGEEALLERIKLSKRVVIVGNSPREIGKGNGKNIDSSDLVIRFNNYPETKEIKVDYGVKCDVWVRSIGSWVDTRDERQFKHVVISGTNLLSRGFNLSHFLHFNEIDTEISVFNPQYHYELIEYLKGPPSAGLMLLYIVYRLKGELVGSDIFGFGFVDQLEESVVNIGKSPAGVRHHWQAELDVYQSMLEGKL